MKFAVISASGTQIAVSEGTVITIDHQDKEKGDAIEFANVLLISDDKDIKIGHPTLSGCKVVGEVLTAGKGKKIRISTFKAKSRFRKTRGFRPSQLTVKITKIIE